jgi:hypothetical protein
MIPKRLLYMAAVCITIMLVYAGCAAPKSPAPVELPPEPVNNPPVISSLTADQQVVQPLGKVLLNCQASDPESDNLSYRWTASGGFLEGSAATAVWTAPNNPGSYKVTVVVSDGRDGSATRDALITIPEKPNNAPVISAIKFTRPGRMAITVKTNPTEKEVKDTPELVIRKYETGDVVCLATDADKDQLTYIWKATGGKIIGNGPSIQWLAAGDPGTYTITCNVADGNGGTATFTITISVHCCSG